MTFELTGKEEEEAIKFKVRHRCKYNHKLFSYVFTPNGIGVGIAIVCSCGAKKDVTDVSRW